ncbi:MAG TPA: HAD hydrolase-like protein, partial [Longimicrobiaceae bacterium]
GTLLSAGGSGKRAFHDALMEVFGTTGPIDGYSFAGRTDPQIARELLAATGIDPAEVESRSAELWRVYVRNLEREIPRTEVRVLPGVLPLLERVEAGGNGTVLGLLTGNVVEGARLKLDAAGIGFGRFRVGAYGSDHADRPELPAVAVARAEALTGHRYREKEIVIVGDTPFDIACGAHLGVRTVAVATGQHPAEELAEHGPDHLFEDLSETERVWEAIAG